MFETGKPIKYGANIGQSLQTLRLLDLDDEHLLDAALVGILKNRPAPITSCGLWTKCDRVFADYFCKNWDQRRQPLAFLLYDPPPTLRTGSPVFIHSDGGLRLLARYREGQFVSGYKHTIDIQERGMERERIWQAHRDGTIDPPTKEQFDQFWEAQDGIRGLFLMDDVMELPKAIAFKVSGRALEWGFPRGVGYRYLSLPQSVLLLRLARVASTVRKRYLQAILEVAGERG